MKKILFSLLLLSFISCGKKEWSRDTVARKCNDDFRMREDASKLFTELQITSICNCIADNLVAKFKSQAEAEKDRAVYEQIGGDCARDVLQKDK